MKSQRFLKKERTSTKDRFRSVLRGEPLQSQHYTPWYRQRGQFIVLIIIIITFFLSFAVKAYYEAKQYDSLEKFQQSILNQQEEESPDPEKEMDYEEAKRIFESTANDSSDS